MKLNSRHNLRFLVLALLTGGLLLAFQNCGSSFNANSSRGDGPANQNLSLENIPEAQVNYNVRYDSSIQTASITPAGTQISVDQLMAKLKYKGCMFNNLVSHQIEDFNEYVNMLARSECESLPRAIETWNQPPDWTFIKTEMNQISTATGKQYNYGMFLAESIATNKTYQDDNGQNFNFSAMCKPGTQGQWGPDTCVPSTSQPEYVRYLNYVIDKAIDAGVSEVLFGQSGYQDAEYRLGHLIHEFRNKARARGHNMIFGQQPNGHQPENYLKAFDYIVGPVYVDRDVSAPCLKDIPGCQAVLYHPDYVSKAHNVIAEFDWYSKPDDDIHNFAKKTQTDTKAYLDTKVSGLWDRGVGFVMPFRIVLTGDKSGKFCYGFNEWIYSPHRNYRCKDEDFINQFLRGGFEVPPQDPQLSREQALTIVTDTFKEVLERTDAEMANDAPGVEYWVGRLQGGYSVEAFKQTLLESDEYFVRGLFKSILKRSADTPGLQFYVEQLKSGLKSRAQVKADLQHVCEKALNNECAWDKVPTTQEPVPPVASVDYTALVKKVFKEVLGRTTAENNADTVGINYWVNRLKSGYSEAAMRLDLRASDEFFVRNLYTTIYNRAADAAGLKFYLDVLKSGQKTRAQIQADFNYICQNKLNECL